MKSNQVMSFFAEKKIQQWLDYYLTKPQGNRNKMMLGVFIEKRNYVVIPLSWRGQEILTYCPIFEASLN